MRFIDESPEALSATPQPAARGVVPDEAIARPDRETLEAHLARKHYGPFTLTDAIRPGWQLDVVPRAGYRHDAYVDPRSGSRLPALIAAVSSEHLFETFLDLLEPLGDTLDVILETSHDDQVSSAEFTREGIERLVLESLLWDFEELLLHDGCTSIAVMHPEMQVEVQLDEHKLLVVYAHDRAPFERILLRQGIERNDRIRFISQGEHMHTSHTRFARRFDEMVNRLGAGG
jgi:hypothetical protein